MASPRSIIRASGKTTLVTPELVTNAQRPVSLKSKLKDAIVFPFFGRSSGLASSDSRTVPSERRPFEPRPHPTTEPNLPGERGKGPGFREGAQKEMGILAPAGVEAFPARRGGGEWVEEIQTSNRTHAAADLGRQVTRDDPGMAVVEKDDRRLGVDLIL